ncbi:MAG: uracil-DNA glycosylase [Parvularculaceae bacterium]
MTSPDQYSPDALRALLSWYAEMGIQDVVGDTSSDMRDWGAAPKLAAQATKKTPPPKPAAATQPAPIQPLQDMETGEAIAQATKLAAAAQDIAALREAIQQFEGCPLKPGARNTVIDDGFFGAPVLILGEAPGRDEDKIGKPCVGHAGQLLDRMIGAINLSRHDDDRDKAYIANTIFWRPPGNRAPKPDEIAICLPFVHRIIDLAKPKLIMTLGNVPTQALFPDAPGITKARGKWREFNTPSGQAYPVLPLFHPAFLLRSPQQKKASWADLLAVKARLHA